jgi:sugar phosphate permease
MSNPAPAVPRLGDTNKRRLVLFTVVFVNFVVWADSGKFGILTPFWSADLGFDPSQIGTISSAYLLGYFPMLFLAGVLADRFGPKPLLVICLVGVTIMGISMIFVQTYDELYWRNLVFGIFFGLLWAPCQRMLSVWFPTVDIPRVTAMWVGAQMLTGLIEPLIALPMADAFGWRVAFVVISLLGVPGIVGLIFLTTSNPRTRKGISAEEIAIIEGDRPQTLTRVPVREILHTFRNRNIVLLVIAGALATTPTWLTSTWASYGIITVGGADASVAAWVIPLLALPGVVYAFMHGRFVNRFLGGRLKPAMLLGVLIPAFGFLVAALVPGLPWWGWAFFASTLGFLTNPLVWGSLNPFFVKEARPEVVGTLNGIAAGLQVAGGYILVSLSGTWIDSTLPGYGSLTKMLVIGAVVFLVAAVPILLLREKRPVRVAGDQSEVHEPTIIAPAGH